MAKNTQDTAALIRQAKYEGFIRHTSAIHDEKTTSEKFSKYVELDKKREDKLMGLRQSVLDGLKG